jgi:CRISPR-associated protein Cmr5
MSVSDLEKNRAIKAYKFASDGKNIIELFQINNDYYKDDNYKSYVKKISMMILNHGLGATFAFIYSKKAKNKKDKKNKNKIIYTGKKENPKNAYDLIYYQVNSWLIELNIKEGKCDPKNICYKEKNKDCEKIDLIEWIICLNSQEYRMVENEILALFNWLRRFAEGMEDTKNEDT